MNVATTAEHSLSLFTLSQYFPRLQSTRQQTSYPVQARAYENRTVNFLADEGDDMMRACRAMRSDRESYAVLPRIFV